MICFMIRGAKELYDEYEFYRMNWTFHFNPEKKIDQILCYYDRTPIIEAANKNFLVSGKTAGKANDVVIQYITLKSDLSKAELLKIAHERASGFRTIPGLIQKYYVRLDASIKS